MALKITNIYMGWTDTGAVVLSTIPIKCPTCGVGIEANVEHRCGEHKRDPRVDPQNGDVLRKGTTRREVIYREVGAGNTHMANMVQCQDGGWIKKPREVRPTLKQFRKWAANATIEVVAGA